MDFGPVESFRMEEAKKDVVAVVVKNELFWMAFLGLDSNDFLLYG